MRIRNRKVPLPISALCPVPILADPTLSGSSVVQLFSSGEPPLTDAASRFLAAQPFDHLTDPTPAHDAKPEESEGGVQSVKDGGFGAKDAAGESLLSSDEGDDVAKEKGVKLNARGAKKRGRGGALLEGSRCSRVNGRGWRCCQPTLVGYALCEHHLGKGRLKSLTHVRKPTKNHVAPPAECASTSQVKKRVKLGVVKARSLSSLLGIPLDQK